jgi:serine-type D-Ala-D-Ala carboxypeptidase/endopeptidase (penicillin-binding protein 4)
MIALTLLWIVAAVPACQGGENGSAPAVTVAGAPGSNGDSTQRRQPSRRRATTRTPVRTTTSPAVVGPSWTSPRTASALSFDLGNILRGKTRGGTWGVLVVSVTRGDTLFSVNPDALLKPASIMKMMTTGLALERFGPDHTFSTQVLRDGSVSGGVLNGNLVLRGGGDPTLSLRFWKGQSPTDDLARQIAAAGIRRVTGDIVADESAFDVERVPVGWKSSYLNSAYAAPVSALSLNENLVWIVARPQNGTAVVELDPPSATIPLTSNVRVVGGGGGRIVARRTGEGISVSGTIGARSGPRRYSLVINEPPTFAAGALLSSLRKAGIEVTGKVRMGKAQSGAERVAELHSIPMANIVSYMNRESINHFAELLYRDAAIEKDGRPVSSRDALEALREFLSAKTGTRREDVRVADGSGLSEADSITPRSMVHLLGYAHRAPWSSVFHASMPVAGESELMRRRMRSTPAHGNLHAKTGTTNTVASLAGYVTALNGEVLAFAFIYNGRDRFAARATMDRMGPTLANFFRD